MVMTPDTPAFPQSALISGILDNANIREAAWTEAEETIIETVCCLAKRRSYEADSSALPTHLNLLV
jgi:hypothetical protein